MPLNSPEMWIHLRTNVGEPVKYFGQISWVVEPDTGIEGQQNIRRQVHNTPDHNSVEEAFLATLYLANDVGWFDNPDDLIPLLGGAVTFMRSLK